MEYLALCLLLFMVSIENSRACSYWPAERCSHDHQI